MLTRDSAAVPERRFVGGKVRLETRAGGEGKPSKPRICGRAILYNTWTTLYESKTYSFRERILPGAATNALAEKQDVRCLFNHCASDILGRTVSGTLTLTQDDDGVDIDCDPPDTQYHRDKMLAPIERGDVTGQSFAFLIRQGGQKYTVREEGDRIIEEREISDIDLYDVGPVTYPQYEETDVSIRSFAERRDKELRTRSGRQSLLMRFKQRHVDSLFFPV